VQRRHQNTTQNWAAWVNQRIAAAAQADRESLVRVIGKVISIERAKHRKEIQTAVAETTRAFESKLERLEEKLIAQPGQLPMAKFWYPETVVYRGDIVTHEGETFQAKKDTASRPPGPDWFLVARAGRDATMPHVRGTFVTTRSYKALDIVAQDGASFIAKRDNPGICPGDGWQLLVRQGKSGRRGDKGDTGPRGEKGEPGPAVMPQLVSSKIDENYNLTILRADDSLEIIPLRDAFERFWNETGEG
jgi:hypothetical protein